MSKLFCSLLYTPRVNQQKGIDKRKVISKVLERNGTQAKPNEVASPVSNNWHGSKEGVGYDE